MEKEMKEVMALAMAQKWDAAKALADKMIQSHPGDLNARVVRADIENLSGNGKEAFRRLREVLRENPEFASAHYSMGVLFGRESRWDKSRASLEKALSLYPPEEKEAISDAFLQLGIACWEQRRPGDALDAWKSALVHNPGQWKAREYLEEFTPDWSKPKILGDPEWFDAFKALHVKKYLSALGSDDFSSLAEADGVLKKIVAAWNAIPDKWKLEDLSQDERERLFHAISPFEK